MATVINKTTLELIKSAHTPNYPTQDWIINPDLSSVEGVPKKYWKIAGNQVLEMNAQEKSVVDAAETAAALAANKTEAVGQTQSLQMLALATVVRNLFVERGVGDPQNDVTAQDIVDQVIDEINNM